MNWAAVKDYGITSASGGVTGQFDSVQSNLAFLTPSLVYGGTSISLSMMRNDISFASVGETGNQRSTAAGLDSLGAWAIYGRIVSLDSASARDAFDALSGEVHRSVQIVALEDSGRVRKALMQRSNPVSTKSDGMDDQTNGVWV